jgi:hypothetical protein
MLRETLDPNRVLLPSIPQSIKMSLVIKGNEHWNKLELLTPPFGQSSNSFRGRSESKK